MNINKRIEKLEKELNDIKEKVKKNSVPRIVTKINTLKRTIEMNYLKPVGIVLSSNLYEILMDDCRRQIGIGNIDYFDGLPIRKDISTVDMVSLEVTTDD